MDRSRPAVTPALVLRGRWLGHARAAWVTVAVAALGLWGGGLLLMVRSGERYYVPGMAETLAALGLSGRAVAPALTFLLVLPPTLAFVGTALVLFLRRPSDPMALFVSFALLTVGTLVQRPATVVYEAYPAARPAVAAGWVAATAALLLLLYTFPDGRLVPRWTRWLAGPVVGLSTVLALPGVLPPLFSFTGLPAEVPAWQAGLLLGGFAAAAIAGVSAQVYRYRRVSGPVERQQTKWVIASLAALLLWTVCLVALPTLFFSPPALWTGSI